MDSHALERRPRRRPPVTPRRKRRSRRLTLAVLALLVGSLVVASAAPADGPSPPPLDDFNRPDENPLSRAATGRASAPARDSRS